MSDEEGIGRNWLEWLILAISVVAIVALVGYLGIAALRGEEPASIAIEVHQSEARQAGAGWAVPATVRNDGGTAAAGVAIEAVATVGGADESSDLVVDLLPAGSSVELTLGFSGRPTDVSARVVGHQSP